MVREKKHRFPQIDLVVLINDSLRLTSISFLLFFLFQAASGQGGGESQEGLGGESFNPVVKASCAGGRMNIQVRKKQL